MGRLFHAFDGYALLAALGRFGAHLRLGSLYSGDVLEERSNVLQHRPGAEISGDRQHGICRRVETPVVLIQVFTRHPFQVRHVADDFMVVWMDAKRRRLDLFGQTKRRLVLVPLPLRDDHGPLRVNLGFLKQAAHHSIGFKPEAQIDLVGGHRLEIRRPIDPRHGVPDSTVARNGPVENAGREVRGAFELHVFDPVGDAGRSLPFVARTDAIPDPAADQGRGVDLLQPHLKSVAQPGLGDGAAVLAHELCLLAARSASACSTGLPSAP